MPVINNELPFRSLTIHLSKENQTPGSLIKVSEHITNKTVPVGGRTLGQLFIKPPDAKPPMWADLFDPYVRPGEFGEVSSSSAVLLVPIYKRWAALTFGQGRHLLTLNNFEDRFGLRVALNCIDEKKVKVIDKQSFDAIASQTLEQAARESNAREFGFDIERDLLKAVTGTPRHKDFGKRLSGKEALTVLVQVELNQLTVLLETFHKQFFSTSYRTNFDWVDKIREVTNPTLVSDLNDAVIDLIRSRQFDERCWLAVPDIIDWSQVSGFRYSNANRQPEHFDLDLSRFLETIPVPSALTEDKLKNRDILCMDPADQVIGKWTVFNCLYCELDHKGHSYILNAGKWYELDRDFVRLVNTSFAKIPKYLGSFTVYDDDTEGEYNKRLVDENNSEYCLMDRNLTYLGGAMEFCDVFSRSKELIHIKRYSGSATLSHLFYQGMASAEFFQMDPDYRKLVLSKLPKQFQIFTADARPGSEEYHVVFGIITSSKKQLTMPFFSRVGIRHAVRRLQVFRYRVSLARIDVADERSKRKKCRSKPIR